MEFYKLTANTPKGETIDFSAFKGKTVLVVNTATKCGLTPQLEALEKLHQQYNDKGLVVLGFPCNQFLNQEPETNESVEQTCLINYGVTFQLTEKVNVNGTDTHPVFKYLKSELGGWFGRKVKWNFTKFLIDKQGVPYKRYAPTTKPEEMEADIIKLINA